MESPMTTPQVSSANQTTAKPDFAGKKKKKLALILDYANKHRKG